MAFLNKSMLAKMAGVATAEKHPMLDELEVPLNVKEAYLQGCVLAGILKDGVLSALKKDEVLRLGSSLQLAEAEISECISLVTGLTTDEAKEQFVGEMFAVLAGDTYPRYFLKDFEGLLMEDGKLPDDMADYLDYFGSTLCNDKNWRKIVAEKEVNKTTAGRETGPVNNSESEATAISTGGASDVDTLATSPVENKTYSCLPSCKKSHEDPLFQRVRQIIVEQLGVNYEQVTLGASFIDDLGADSLDAIELIMAFEEEMGLDIPDEDVERLVTVGRVMDYLHARGIH